MRKARTGFEKLLTSRRIDSMEEYVIVSCDPEKPEVAAFRRAEGWEPGETVQSGEIAFSSIGVTVSVGRALREPSGSLTLQFANNRCNRVEDLRFLPG